MLNARQLAGRQPVAPVILGIDELTLAGERRCILTDVDERRVLDLLPSGEQEGLADWLRNLPDRERIRVVTIDMHGPYKVAARAALPHATIVVDKWHIQRKANDALDHVRARLARGLHGKAKRQVMRGRQLLHARADRLSTKARAALDEWLQDDSVLADAWEAKGAFCVIWDGQLRGDRERLFSAWHNDLNTRWRSVIEEFGSLLWTVRNWRREIFAYFRTPFTNAYTEAANGLVKIANTAGRGCSFETIRRRALLMSTPGDGAGWICESCLGQFATDPAHLDEMGPHDGLCGVCALLVYLVPDQRLNRGRSR
jgi:transposase